jgi:hypothetical protein
MRFYLNEASVQAQFKSEDHFRTDLENIMKARARSPHLSAMRTTPRLADRPVFHDRTFRAVVQGWKGLPLASAVLAWVGRNGPFLESDRLAEDEDLFQCLGLEVTEGGLGEAARRQKASESVASLSFSGGEPDFARSPLPVVHGFEDKPLGLYPIANFWSAETAIEATIAAAVPASTWRGMIEAARIAYPSLQLPDTLHTDRRLAREPFDPIIRDRFYALLQLLEAYMQSRNKDGTEGPASQELLRDHFQGDRALFSPESRGNQDKYRDDMTFPNPDGNGTILAHWHGKISHRTYRLHFDWPVPAKIKRLNVLYIGPKITK